MRPRVPSTTTAYQLDVIDVVLDTTDTPVSDQLLRRAEPCLKKVSCDEISLYCASESRRQRRCQHTIPQGKL